MSALRIRIKGPTDQRALEEVGRLIDSECVIAYPTDTLYGLGCSPFDVFALDRIYGIKGRESAKPLPVLLDAAWRLKSWCEEIPDIARRLFAHWPAPLTIILDVRSDLPGQLLRGGNSLGFRVPASPLCRAIVSTAGGSLISTSINRSGMPPLLTPDEILRELEEEIDAVVDAGELPPSLPSTVIRCSGNDMRILRHGAFSFTG